MEIKQIEFLFDWPSLKCHGKIEEKPVGDFWQLVTLSLLLLSKDYVQINTQIIQLQIIE